MICDLSSWTTVIQDWALGVTAIMDWLLEPVLGSEDSDRRQWMVTGNDSNRSWWLVISDWLLALQTGDRFRWTLYNQQTWYEVQKKGMLFIAKVCFKIKSPIYQHWVRQESWDSGCTHCGKPPIAQKNLEIYKLLQVSWRIYNKVFWKSCVMSSDC